MSWEAINYVQEHTPELACRRLRRDVPFDAGDAAGVVDAGVDVEDGKTTPFEVGHGCSACVASWAGKIRSRLHWCPARDREDEVNVPQLAMVDAIPVYD